MSAHQRPGLLRRYGFLWVTGGFFVLTIVGHWIFGWFAFVAEQNAHGAAPDLGEFAIQMTRDTLENWQSEFLQLVWQVGGLASCSMSARRNRKKATTGWKRRSTPSFARSSRKQTD